MRYVKRSFIAVGLAACVSLLLPSGAAGKMTNEQDPAGDVVVVRIDAGPNLEHIARLRREIAHGDIRSLHANHAYTRLIATVHFRNLNRTKPTSQDFVILTPQSRYNYNFEQRGSRIRYPFFYNETQDSVVRCPGLETRVNLAEDRVRVFVPRGCLDRPRWMRVGVQTFGAGYDDALRRGRNDSDWLFDGPALGSRLSRGQR